MPYEKFDRSRLKLLPLSERAHDLDISIMMDPSAPVESFCHPALNKIASAVREAKKQSAAVIMMCGAHVIRSGVGPFIIKLMEEGYISLFATNGAGAIHDFEMAMIGATCESVAKYISEGQFGLWQESGRLNDALSEGAKINIGAGEAVGKYIMEHNFKHINTSIFAQAVKLGIPATVHIGVGSDIIHEHGNCDGASLGITSYNDFLIYAKITENLENGVFLNFGSAVAGPEVYLKCLAMARNVAHQEGRSISHYTTAVFDLLDIDEDNYSETPPKSDPRYYFRPWKTILSRTVADGGQSFYVKGEHRLTVPALAKLILEG